jgi:uncharacterized membrane protein
MPTIKQIISSFLKYMWSLFLHGLLTILPIVITFAIFNVTLNMITNWLRPIHAIQPLFLQAIPYSEVILAILIIFFIGTILKLFFLHSVFHFFESLISKIPIIRPVYTGIKQLVQAFSPQDQLTFKKVVLVEFPSKGIYSLGFLTGELSPELAPNQIERFFNIFIPTTPNPTTGFFVIISEVNITLTNFTRQEAMALIISGGIIQPERLIRTPQPS